MKDNEQLEVTDMARVAESDLYTVDQINNFLDETKRLNRCRN